MENKNMSIFQGRPKEQKKIESGNLGDGIFKGIVTPQMQRMGGIGKTGYKIEDLINKPELRDRFQKNEFPVFDKTSDGIFFQPIGKVFSTSRQYYIKWFSLDAQLNISHDHDYQYVRLNPNGYLMKISTQLTGFVNDFEVNYVTKVDKFNPVTVTVRPDRANVDSLTSDPVDIFMLPPFNPSEYPKLVELFMDHENFVNTYLRDIIDQN